MLRYQPIAFGMRMGPKKMTRERMLSCRVSVALTCQMQWLLTIAKRSPYSMALLQSLLYHGRAEKFNLQKSVKVKGDHELAMTEHEAEAYLLKV
jgi:hypothetical protein